MFVCVRCDNPIQGSAVSADVCVRCLMGVECECEICGGELDTDDSICESCQEKLDNELEDIELYDFTICELEE